MRSDFMDMFLVLQQPTCYTEEITHAIMGLSFCLGGWDRSHLLAIHTIYLLIRILQRIQNTWYKILSIQLWLPACKWTFEKKLSDQLQIKWMMMRSVIGWWVVEKRDILLVFIHYGSMGWRTRTNEPHLDGKFGRNENPQRQPWFIAQWEIFYRSLAQTCNRTVCLLMGLDVQAQ